MPRFGRRPAGRGIGLSGPVPTPSRADAIARTPHGLLGRGVARICGEAPVVYLSFFFVVCRDGYRIVRPALMHALELIVAHPTEHLSTT
jgi:hypothetical protein